MELKPGTARRRPQDSDTGTGTGTGIGFWQGVARLLLDMLQARAQRYGPRPPRRPG